MIADRKVVVLSPFTPPIVYATRVDASGEPEL